MVINQIKINNYINEYFFLNSNFSHNIFFLNRGLWPLPLINLGFPLKWTKLASSSPPFTI